MPAIRQLGAGNGVNELAISKGKSLTARKKKKEKKERWKLSSQLHV